MRPGQPHVTVDLPPLWDRPPSGGLALFGVLLLYDFNEREREGGSRRMNVILYGLYSVIGKWGVASLAWAGSTVCVKAAIKRMRRQRES